MRFVRSGLHKAVATYPTISIPEVSTEGVESKYLRLVAAGRGDFAKFMLQYIFISKKL